MNDGGTKVPSVFIDITILRHEYLLAIFELSEFLYFLTNNNYIVPADFNIRELSANLRNIKCQVFSSFRLSMGGK